MSRIFTRHFPKIEMAHEMNLRWSYGPVQVANLLLLFTRPPALFNARSERIDPMLSALLPRAIGSERFGNDIPIWPRRSARLHGPSESVVLL